MIKHQNATNCTIFLKKNVHLETLRPPFCSFMPAAITDRCRHEAIKRGPGGFRSLRHSRRANICCGKVIENSWNFIDEYPYEAFKEPHKHTIMCQYWDCTGAMLAASAQGPVLATDGLFTGWSRYVSD